MNQEMLGKPSRNEAEWLAGKHPYEIIYHKTCRSDRKRRLLACACSRRVLHLCDGDERLANGIETSEQYADGNATFDDLKRARRDVRKVLAEMQTDNASESAWDSASGVLCVLEKEFMSYKMVIERAAASQAALTRPSYDKGHDQETLAQCAIVRDIFRNPFRPVAVDPAWRAWNDGTVVKLARTIYDERKLPSGHLDAGRLAILADALEEAGCQDAEILGHCRQPGPHVRGCWVVDLLLGKE